MYWYALLGYLNRDFHVWFVWPRLFFILERNGACSQLRSEHCFQVFHSSATKFALRIKEAIHIKRENPCLNSKVKHINFKLFYNTVVSFCFLYAKICSYIIFTSLPICKQLVVLTMAVSTAETVCIKKGRDFYQVYY